MYKNLTVINYVVWDQCDASFKVWFTRIFWWYVDISVHCCWALEATMFRKLCQNWKVWVLQNHLNHWSQLGILTFRYSEHSCICRSGWLYYLLLVILSVLCF